MRWLITLAALVPLCLVGGSVRAQSNPPFKNPSLDSNCYFPQIGVPGEIDTIYGDSANEELGGFIHNLGPNPDGTPGNMLIGSEIGASWSETQTGPNFNLHDLKAKAQKLNFNPNLLHFCHLHDRNHIDIFNGNIYWADDKGNYDSSRYTVLKENLPVNIRPGSHRSVDGWTSALVCGPFNKRYD